MKEVFLLETSDSIITMALSDILIKISSVNGPINANEIGKLVNEINKNEIFTINSVNSHVQKKKIGDFYYSDPTISNLIIPLANSALLGIIIKGLIDIFLQWQKNCSCNVEITAHGIHLVIPRNITKDELDKIVEKVEELKIK